MDTENIYENREQLQAAEEAPKTPALPPQRKTHTTCLLAVLVLLLGVLLGALAVLYFQKEQLLQGQEGLIEKLRCCQQLSNVSFAPGTEAEDARFVDAQPVQNCCAVAVELQSSADEAFRTIQACLGTILASQAVAEKRNRDLLEMLSNDWVLYNGSWYLFSEEKRPWWEAEEACGSLGAHLASVTSQKEMGFIVRKTKGQSFWVGLNDQQEEGNWTWLDGTQYSQDVSFWAPEQPDNWHGAPGHQEDCVEVRYGGLNSWNDVSCTLSSKWICKKIF